MKKLLLAFAATAALMATAPAMARVDVGISIGIPGLIYTAPDYYYYPPPPVRYIERPRVIVVPERHYRPVRAHGPRYYRESYRDNPHHYKPHKQGKGKGHHRGHR